ncbi:hypothetical protein J2129_000626 [Methanofollis sp. W23]|nr:hypothetical protein [Methanofollis sp. W23]
MKMIQSFYSGFMDENSNALIILNTDTQRKETPSEHQVLCLPSLSSSQGSGGRAPGTNTWEGTSVRRAALNRSIFPGISHRGASAPRTPHDEERWGRRWNEVSTSSPVLKRKREQVVRNFHPVCLNQGSW